MHHSTFRKFDRVWKSSAVRYFVLPQCGAVQYKVLAMALKDKYEVCGRENIIKPNTLSELARVSSLALPRKFKVIVGTCMSSQPKYLPN